MSKGTVYGLGLGPGDPELMTVKAHRLLTSGKHVAFFRKEGRPGRSRKIVEGLLPEAVIEFPMEYPVTTEIPLDDPRYNQVMAGFYEDCTAHIRQLVEAGEEVVVLCEGDPFFYGSFMHLYTRLKDVVPVEVVPAITGMSASWTATGAPITWGDDVLSVLMGTLDAQTLTARMRDADAIVVMKIGRHLEKVRQALRDAGKYDRAWIVQFASMEGQTVQKLSDLESKATPYFSIVIVHGQGRRP
jgi:precorrin-2/cobalt-factor-2 C20-methyltransferase